MVNIIKRERMVLNQMKILNIKIYDIQNEKNVLAGISSRLDAREEKTLELEGRMIGVIQNEARREQSLEKVRTLLI